MPGENRKSWSAELAPYLTLGIQLAVAVVAFFFVGRWLDGLFGTSPWLMIAGLLLGTAGGFLQFFRTAAALGRRQDRRSADGKKTEDHADES
jgi:F0F1-type ATP synthase assembly protein I